MLNRGAGTSALVEREALVRPVTSVHELMQHARAVIPIRDLIFITIFYCDW